MKHLLAAALASASIWAAAPAFADEAQGEVLAFGRVAGILVLTDKTVWPVTNLLDTLAPELVAGDTVHIVYTSAGENGVAAVTAVHKIEG